MEAPNNHVKHHKILKSKDIEKIKVKKEQNITMIRVLENNYLLTAKNSNIISSR